MPLPKPSRAAGPAGASVGVEPPPAVGLNELLQTLGTGRLVVSRLGGQ
jgi:hypothetical protein